MIVYNTTFHIEKSVADKVIVYFKNIYMPQAAASGFLLSPRMRRIIMEDESEGVSYSIQFHVKNTDTLNFWLESEGRTLQKNLVTKFGHNVNGFTTLLEEIDWER